MSASPTTPAGPTARDYLLRAAKAKPGQTEDELIERAQRMGAPHSKPVLSFVLRTVVGQGLIDEIQPKAPTVYTLSEGSPYDAVCDEVERRR